MASNPLDKVYLTEAQLNTLANGGSITSGNDTYTADESTMYLTDDTSVSYETQTLTSGQQSQARQNIGAGTSNFSGSYNDLTDKPTIPTDTNQKIKTSSVTFGDDDVVEIVAGSNVTVTGDATNKTITIASTASGGTATDVQVDSTSITSGGVADLKTINGDYNASSNKLATQSDLPASITITTTSGSESVSDGTNTLSFGSNAFNSTTIPTKVSDLNNDSGFISTETDPTVPSWAKASTKPSYSYSEISNTPTIPTALSDLSDDSTHRLVTDTEKSTWSGKQSALPTTTTAGNVLKSTSTAGTVQWGTLSASDVGAEPTISTKNTAFNKNFETSSSNIKMNGSVSVGELSTVARADHIHPSDTSKQDTLSSSNKLNADYISDGTTNKAYTATEQTKLSGIETGAEVNDVTDFQVNGTSIVSSKIANLVTNTAYNSSTNKIATMSDIPSMTDVDYINEIASDHIRYESGLQICWERVTWNSVNHGTVTRGFPKNFKSGTIPAMTVEFISPNLGSSASVSGSVTNQDNTGFQLTYYGVGSGDRCTGFCYIAIGFWE